VAPNNERPKYHQVEVGSIVYTSDEQLVGTVSEKRGQHFKIKTSMFHRDFWLRTDSVRSSEAGQRVILNAPQARLDEIKITYNPEKD